MLLSVISILPKANAQTTYEEMEQLTVNEQITTVITASEPVRFVDISTDKVAGDQPIDNVIRLKPKEAGHEDGEVLAVVTIVTERYRTQYALIYTTRMKEAVTDKEIAPFLLPTAVRTSFRPFPYCSLRHFYSHIPWYNFRDFHNLFHNRHHHTAHRKRFLPQIQAAQDDQNPPAPHTGLRGTQVPDDPDG